MKKIYALLMMLVLVGCKEERTSTTLTQEKCTDKPLVVEIKGYKIKAKREGLGLILEDGLQLNNLDRGIKCDESNISKVVSARWPRFEIANPDKQETRYHRAKDFLNKPENIDRIFTLENGVKHLDSYIFIYPQSLISTGNGEPAVHYCSYHDPEKEMFMNICRAGYVHPSGLIIRYSFDRAKIDRSEFVIFDQTQRAKFESLIIDYPHEGETP